MGLDWIITIGSCYAAWLLAKKDRNGWLVKLALGVPWVLIAVRYELWGFLPATIVTTVISISGYLKWGKDNREQAWRIARARCWARKP